MGNLKSVITLLVVYTTLVRTWPYDPDQIGYNTNENISATNPADYWGQWKDHEYFPSPDNWRFPVYTLFIDRFVNGDPTNDNINGTNFERDISSTQLRHGGDVAGLVDTLDYLQGMGIKGIYIAGTILLNQPWGADGYSVIDTTLLDRHFGDISSWRAAISEIHRRGMYVLFDNTLATLGDLIGFKGFLNETTPFNTKEHKALWKSSRKYADFDFSNTYNETCDYPRFWLETGEPVGPDITNQLKGCYDSEFDQYGDLEAFGVFPDWQRQLTKFASVQDRLREWIPSVRNKLIRHSCLMITQLDIDGFRYDKATQATVDALGDMSSAYRECARSVGKNNFFLPGEITGGDTLGAIYIGRGRQPDMYPPTAREAVQLTDTSNQSYFLRARGNAALDSGAFHYSIYRSLTRFLGMDGNLAAGYDVPVNWVSAWNQMLTSNDFVNVNTGKFDPRHMFGATNQDVFRWPAIRMGTERMLLAMYITTLHLPGIPLLLWGEEQAFYILDNTAKNYMFGRQPITSSTAWQTHGCYALGSAQYYQWPVESAKFGCYDDTVSYDHRDPSHPIRNILKSMYQMRENYPVLNDGWYLRQLSKQTFDSTLPGSNNTPTETGVWSVLRAPFPGVQDLGKKAGPIWLVYQNHNEKVDYHFDCNYEHTALISPFDTGTTVKNLFYPYDEVTLQLGPVSLGFGGSKERNGCLDHLNIPPYGFKAYVPKESFIEPRPMITRFVPGHDARLESIVGPNQHEKVRVELSFSTEMSCDDVTRNIVLNSTTNNGKIPFINPASVNCTYIRPEETKFIGELSGIWQWSATLEGVYNGIHRLTVRNATTSGGDRFTNAVDHFLFRIGQPNNPMIFTRSANYSRDLLHRDEDNNLYISQHASGADLYRYTLDWGSTFSDWIPYSAGNASLKMPEWSGTKLQHWHGEHVSVEYWNRMAGSSSHLQHGDLDWEHKPPRRFPHLFWNGPYNKYGYDSGLNNRLTLEDNGEWKFRFMAEWPAVAQINVWGINPDGKPDQQFLFGDSNGDSVLDRLPPSSLAKTVINITDAPPYPHLSWVFTLDDGTLRFKLHPVGSRHQQFLLAVLLSALPLATATIAILFFRQYFYQIKFNQGIESRHRLRRWAAETSPDHGFLWKARAIFARILNFLRFHPIIRLSRFNRRTILIATMEYDIPDWRIKIKIGGLGVMAQLMGNELSHQNLIWVVPCVGDVNYPIDNPVDSIFVTILGKPYEVLVQYHVYQNITYVLLDAPVFRQQSTKSPYPQRMDDLGSAIYYSAWNQCIALIISRFPVDIYHANDYHGSIAPLYLLPKTIPTCLSLHNAEFQGLWPMRTPKEKEEVCSIFSLGVDVATRYIQFGDVFNLLHGGVSYLRIHQGGFGAVGVSKKYGKRSFLRYPIFWGLKRVGNLPNPDPTDTGCLEKQSVSKPSSAVFEHLRRKNLPLAQSWAGLDINPRANLMVFVGRWTMQKGIDLIADILPSLLNERKDVQVICVGPIVDIYGRFAALKLAKIKAMFPGRILVWPEFITIPACVYYGAEFALIPSRDEPFGLVAVEFGRKGVLGIGARVGGLGQMPGWWYSIESTATSHLLRQFKLAIKQALSSSDKTRAKMRARAIRQRFPVMKWVEGLEILHTSSIDVCEKQKLFGDTGLPWSESQPDTPARESSPSSESPGCPPSPSMSSSSSTASLTLQELNYYAQKECNPNPMNIITKETLTLTHSLLPTIPLPAHTDPRSPVETTVEGQDYSRKGMWLNLLASTKINSAQKRQSDLSLSQYSTPFQLGGSNHTSVLSLDTVVGAKRDFNLQKVDPLFNDTTGKCAQEFVSLLESLRCNNSLTELCVEEFLVRSQKKWYKKFRHARLGRTKLSDRKGKAVATIGDDPEAYGGSEWDEFEFGNGYSKPAGLKRWMQFRVGDWPLYSLILGLGQIMASNSYQITLLTGEVGQSATKLYVIASVYGIASIAWWFVFRSTKPVIPLSLPFMLYGTAFFLIGIAHYGPSEAGRTCLQGIGTAIYAIASSSGSIFFSLNFGDESGAPVKDWVFRACVIQGTQQLYVVALWYWGSVLARTEAADIPISTDISNTWKITAICLPIALFLWTVGLVVYHGLPDYYRQTPGKVPSFYRSVRRRKIIIWFFIAVFIQNFFLSAPYGRNWSFLWSSNYAKPWHIVALIGIFFGGVWFVVLALLSLSSKRHSWVLPVFAIGLGAPRWAQIWWGTSNIGLYFPVTGNPLTAALASRGVWLWLGVLDAIQGVGLGMVLLQTLTRLHICFTLLAAQVFGSIATICARGFAPNNVGPGPIHPDISGGIDTIWTSWFWITLVFQAIICTGFFLFFRSEQLSKA
ncbi:Cell wall alpha-1,3-glucan synthase ags1 [Myotisia sp. PD_48]|nr:Cell wall alpha-1,3-glucan synthase ags1 [Myotisia sp. PD_48]